MGKISIIFIILCLIGCAGMKGKKQTVDPRNKSEINVYSQYWNTGKDSLNLFLHFELPLNHFVFKKSTGYFYSEISFTLVLSDVNLNTQVYRESWDEQVTQAYYEDTRNEENYFTTEQNIVLTPGDYKLFMNIQDKDSRRSWQITKEYKLDVIGPIGTVLPFINDTKLQKSFAVDIMENTDTLWLRTQINLKDSTPDLIHYTVYYKETLIDSGIVSVTVPSGNNLFYLPIPMIQKKRGWYDIELNFQGKKQITSFRFVTNRNNFWTDDIDEMIGVMGIKIGIDGFLSHSEYKKLYGMNESEQWTYIHAYWEKKDPSPNTGNNEILNQLNKRVQYVNNNFSITMPGWRSDRGRIYIIYGPPQYMDDTYKGQTNYTYQKWIYPNGKQFIFVDRSMSGDYTLY